MTGVRVTEEARSYGWWPDISPRCAIREGGLGLADEADAGVLGATAAGGAVVWRGGWGD